MAQLEVQIQRTDSDDSDGFRAFVHANDGREFELGIADSIIEVWREQMGNLDVDQVAERLAKDILEQEPSSDNLTEGFLVTMDNGYATPVAAEQNLRNSGVLPFLASHHDRPAP